LPGNAPCEELKIGSDKLLVFMDSERLRKLEELEKQGVNAYPYRYERTHYSQELKDAYDELEGKIVSVAGRVMSIRSFGKLVFISLQDPQGGIQVMAHDLPEAELKKFEALDAGDVIGAKGKLTKTKKGEVSVAVTEWVMLAKALREPPEKFHGLADTEARYRKRYLDLIANEDSRRVFAARSRIIAFIRSFLDGCGYLEVETPVLQPVYGGAAAKPFKTRHNALDAELFLRIADELYLKRLVVGGFEKVYEIGKDFRNEDIDSRHNPEFTMLEMYSAFEDYGDYMKLTEEMLSAVAKELHGSAELEYKGKKLSFKKPFKRLSFVDAIKKESGVDVLSWKTDADALKVIKAKGLEVSKPTRAHAIDALFDEFVKPKLWDPCFVMDYPAFMCPLTKAKRGDPLLAERFELFIAGEECANAYSELTDPRAQRRKFEEQAEAKRKGDDEAQPMDEDFLEAMEHGMPPMAGLGVGIDRLAMILTGKESIKEVILFPSVKPKGGNVS